MVTREYERDDITVHWDATRCIHTAKCLRAHPGVFDSGRRPWIDLGTGSVAEIAAAVTQCPTGALRFTSDEIVEEVPEPARLRPLRGGPMFVRGDVEVVDSEGRIIAREHRVALCRCGNSGNQPFCDNSHRTAGFEEPPIRGRDDVQAPDEICEPQDGMDD